MVLQCIFWYFMALYCMARSRLMRHLLRMQSLFLQLPLHLCGMKSSRHHRCHINANISTKYIQYICDFLSFRLQILKQRLLKRLKHQKPQLQVWPDQHPRRGRKKELLEAQPNFPRRQCWQHRMNLNRLRHSHDSTVGGGDSIRFDGIIFENIIFPVLSKVADSCYSFTFYRSLSYEDAEAFCKVALSTWL